MPRKTPAPSETKTEGLSSEAQDKSVQELGEVSDEKTPSHGPEDESNARKYGASDDSLAGIVPSKEILDSLTMLNARKSSADAIDNTIDELLSEIRVARQTLGTQRDEAQQRASELESRNAELRASLVQSEQAYSATLEQQSGLEREVKTLRSRLDQAVQSVGELEESKIFLIEELAKVNLSAETAKEESAEELDEGRDTHARREAEKRPAGASEKTIDELLGEAQGDSIEDLDERCDQTIWTLGPRGDAVERGDSEFDNSRAGIPRSKEVLGSIALGTHDVKVHETGSRITGAQCTNDQAMMVVKPIRPRRDLWIAVGLVSGVIIGAWLSAFVTPSITDEPEGTSIAPASTETPSAPVSEDASSLTVAMLTPPLASYAEGQIETLHPQLDSVAQKIVDLEASKASLIEELENVTVDLEISDESRVLDGRPAQSERGQESSGALEQRAELEKQVESLQSQLDTALQGTSELEAAKDGLGEELAKANTSLEAVEASRETLNKRLVQAEQRASELTSQNEELVTGREQANSEMLAQRAEFEEQVEALQSRLDAAAQSASDMEAARNSLTEELTKAKSSLEAVAASRETLNETLVQAQQRASELASQNEELVTGREQANSEMLAQRAEFEEQLDALHSQFEAARQETSDLRVARNSLTGELTKAKSSLEAVVASRETLNETLVQARQRASELASQNEELVTGREQANSEMLAQRAELEKQVDVVQSRLDVALQSTSELEAAKGSLGEELAKVTADLEASKELRRALDERLAEAEQRATELASRNEELVGSREKANSEALAQRAELEKQVQTWQSQLSAAVQSTSELEAAKGSLGEELAKVTADLEASKESRRALDGRLAEAEQRASELASQNEELVASREKANSEMLAQRTESEQQIGALQSQLDAALQSTNELETAKGSLGEELAKVTADLEASKESRRALDERLAEAEQRATELASRYSDQQAVNNSLAEELDGFRTEFANVDDIKNELTVQRANNSQLKQQMTALGHDLEAAREKLVVLDKELQERITVVQTLQAEENALKADLGSAHFLEESLRTELNQSQWMVADLTATTNTQRSQIDALTVKLVELEAHTGEQQTELARASDQMRSIASERDRLRQLFDQAELVLSETRQETISQAPDSGVAELAALEREETLNPEEAEEAANWILRGEELMDLGDIAAARLFFELAAEQGSAKAVTAMGRTYDPVHYERNQVRGIPADPAKALEWYNEGLNAGDAGARRDIDALNVWIERNAAQGN